MYLTFKRLADILFSFFLLLLLFPVFLIFIILLRFTGEGNIFYLQDRIGYKNRKFGIWKFATMLKNSPNIGSGDVTLRNDPRVTPVGHFLRKSKINELPQLINILIGDMSFVGPRPLMEKGFLRYSPFYQSRVYNVKPGLTGIGSVIFRDEEAIVSSSVLPPHECYEQVIMPYKGKLEVWYQEHISFRTDIAILFLTAWYILFPQSQLAYKLFKQLPDR